MNSDIISNMKILAQDYKFRSDLEHYVRNTIGLTPDIKDDHTIEGTRDELAKLKLSDKTIFWGIRCVITDEPTVAKEFDKPDRGTLQEYGVNGVRNKKVK